jgi:hypothetical protein
VLSSTRTRVVLAGTGGLAAALVLLLVVLQPSVTPHMTPVTASPTPLADAAASFPTPTPRPFPGVSEPQDFVLPPACFRFDTPTRSADLTELRWPVHCGKLGPMTADAWREGVRRVALDQGWEACPGDATVLRFRRGDFAMTLRPFSPDAAFVVSQTLAVGGCGT